MKEPYLSCGGYIWPSLLAAGIYFGCLVYTYFSFKETYRLADRSFTTATFLKTLGTACIGTLRERLFFIFLINLFGWYLLAVSLSNFLIDRFHLSTAQLDHYNNYYSLWFTLGGVVGTAWILHRYRAKHVFFWSTLVGSMGVFLLYNTDRLVELWIYMAIPAITEAWVYPAYQTILSDQTNEQNQGKIFGLIGAANGVCQFVATLMLYGVTSASIVLMSALLFLVSVALLPTLLRKKKEELPA